MAPAASKPPAPRKRIRKRKRRAAESSESSSSDSDSSDASVPSTSKATTKPGPGTVTPVSASAEKTKGQSSSDSEEGSDDTSSSDSSSDSDSDGGEASKSGTAVVPKVDAERKVLPPSRSPTPPAVPLPSFLPSDSTSPITQERENEMKAKFRQFWMSSIAEGFKDDLEQIRKEPNLGKSRLGLLIDSLAAGADVFTTHSGSSSERRLDAMDVIMTDASSSTS